ncbi:MAG TPA: hypothetical protein VGH54_07450 [Mycobacterium sp.]|jgi:hypothetical protein|uniref:hypothetical protein n=1 Tax=Mycobacterium sp. TaxID=1785 RepID=UPI002F40AD72
MKRKLVIAAACLATALMTGGIAKADPEAPAPDPNGPKCDIWNGGDDGNKWERVPCGWAYGDQKGWYQLPQ